jgi:hypothetical protein
MILMIFSSTVAEQRTTLSFGLIFLSYGIFAKIKSIFLDLSWI